MSADPNADTTDVVVPVRTRLVRSLAATAASLCGIVGLLLIVFSTSQKQIEIGVLLGFWAGLIAAFLAFGSRRPVADTEETRTALETQVAELRTSQLQLRESHDELRSSQIELVKVQTEQANQTIALRERVEQARTSEIVDPDLLRRELNRLLTEQIGSLRDEIAGLRADMVDKLSSELRLERIETTRVVGADLETLQREIRKLAANQSRTIEAPPTPAVAPAVSQHEEIVVEPYVDDVVVAAPDATPAEYVDDSPAIPHVTADAFANLPRLSPVPAEVVDLIFDDEDVSAAAPAPTAPQTHAASQPTGTTTIDEEPLVEWRTRLADRLTADKPYVGRRRAADAGAEPAPGTVAEASGTGGGRRRAPVDRR